MTKYWYTREVNLTFDTALDKVELALWEEWFGILSRIDIKSKIKEKLWKDFDDYIVLWACNPKLAYEAIQNELEIWLLLPCNIIIYNNKWKIYVSTIVPTVAMDIVNNQKVLEVARIAEEKLKRAIDSVK